MNNVLNSSFEGLNACTGCQICSIVCPQKAINLMLNENGFYTPFIDKELCNNCGLCKNSCYRFEKDFSSKYNGFEAWACRSTDDNVLNKSSSGGASYHLCQLGLKMGYKILGVSYNYDKDIAEAKITKTDIQQFFGSKYIQPYFVDAYDELFNSKNDENVLVFGLPCHIYAIDKLANQKGIRDKFVLVDLFCHGCPSMLAWSKNVKEIKNKLGEKRINDIQFRSKKSGWHEYCMTAKTENCEYIGKNEYQPFYELFFSNQILNEACNNCKLRGSWNHCDIRIGDFWGHIYDSDKKGVSAVVAVTEKGKSFVNNLPNEIFIKQHELTDITAFQSGNVEYTVDNTIRNKIFAALKSQCTIEDAVKIYVERLPLKARIIRIIKKMFIILPLNSRQKIKQCIHKKVYNRKNVKDNKR